MPGTVLVVVDVQERLFNAMDAECRDEMVGNIKVLIAACRRLGVPIVLTEQYPRGLGRTLPEITAALPDVPPLEKTSFSCCAANGFLDRLGGADHVVLAGIEAHVCVLMTALDLLGRGIRVSVVADAVCSRKPSKADLGIAQARQAGAVVTAAETVVFQLLGGADNEAFRELSKLLR